MINRRNHYINSNTYLLEKMKYDNNTYESSPISLEKVGVKMARSNSNSKSCKSTTKRSNSRSNSRSNKENRSKTSR